MEVGVYGGHIGSNAADRSSVAIVTCRDDAMPLKTPDVIVIDDDGAVRRSLAFALEQEGLRVLTFADGAEALAVGRLPNDACLVVDFYMPGLDGIALVERLRALQDHLPAILITAKPSEDMRAAAARAGIARVLEKPLEDGSLLREIRAVLDGRPAAREVSGTALR